MPRQHVLRCEASQAQPPASSFCVQASPNPEYSSQKANYAHWLLAHLFPLLRAALTSGDHNLVGATLHIGHGGNTVLPVWGARYAELFGVTCTRRIDDASGQLNRLGCNVRLNVSVARYAFCRRAFWNPSALRSVAKYLRARFGLLPISVQGGVLAAASHPAARIVVLTRRGTDGFRRFSGLDRACEPSFDARAAERGVISHGISIGCVSFNMSTPLAVMATTVGAPEVRALLSGHGAGLANVLFMRPGAAMAEFDAIRNMASARNFYQYLPEGVGVRSTKVWLNASGARFCPARVNACGGGNLNMYRASISIPEAVLDDVLHEVSADGAHSFRDCGILRDEEGSKMYHSMPRQPGWKLWKHLEMTPWKLEGARGG